MREILLASCPVMLWVLTGIHVLFLVLMFRAYGKSRNILFLLSGLITCGLFYDSLMLALGVVMQEGGLLMALSRVRFVAHGGLITLIFAICAYALDFKGIWKTIGWVFTGTLVILGIAEGFAVKLLAQHAAGIVRYTSGPNTPGWANIISSLLTFGTVFPLMIAGILVWVKQKTPTLFLSGFLMFAFSALGPATGNFDLIFYISMFGEVLMALYFYLYARKKTGM